jgi:alanine-synthesizing transaminase
MTGWRLGYIYYHDPQNELQEIKQCIEKEARIRLCANTPVQKAGVTALRGPQDHVKEMVEKLRQRRDYTVRRLNALEGISCIAPEGTFYVFPRIHEIGSIWKTDREFALALLRETGVLLVHGSGFDPIHGARHVRSVILPPIETLEKALNEVERFMKER